jgi:hypothetical protein
MFSITSRYAGLPIVEHVTSDGRSSTSLRATRSGVEGRAIAYVRRRFVPAPERFDTLFEHVVTEGERLDVITAQQLGEPEQFWRLCDANGAIYPWELEVVGRRLRITMPEGIPRPAVA